MDKQARSLTQANNLTGLGVSSIPVDCSDLKKVYALDNNILIKYSLSDADISNDYQIITPQSVIKSVASQTKSGLIKFYDGDYDNNDSVITPSDLDELYNWNISGGIIQLYGSGSYSNGYLYYQSNTDSVHSSTAFINEIDIIRRYNNLNGNNYLNGWLKILSLSDTNNFNFRIKLYNTHLYDNFLTAIEGYMVQNSIRQAISGYATKIVINNEELLDIFIYTTNGVFNSTGDGTYVYLTLNHIIYN